LSINIGLHLLQVNLCVGHEGIYLLLLLLDCLQHHLESLLILRPFIIVLLHSQLWVIAHLFDLLCLNWIHVLLGCKDFLLNVGHLLLNHTKASLNVAIDLTHLRLKLLLDISLFLRMLSNYVLIFIILLILNVTKRIVHAKNILSLWKRLGLLFLLLVCVFGAPVLEFLTKVGRLLLVVKVLVW